MKSWRRCIGVGPAVPLQQRPHACLLGRQHVGIVCRCRQSAGAFAPAFWFPSGESIQPHDRSGLPHLSAHKDWCPAFTQHHWTQKPPRLVKSCRCRGLCVLNTCWVLNCIKTYYVDSIRDVQLRNVKAASSDCWQYPCCPRRDQKSLFFCHAGGLVQVSSFAVLPDIGAGTTLVVVLISMAPMLIRFWRNPRPKAFASAAAYACICR